MTRPTKSVPETPLSRSSSLQSPAFSRSSRSGAPNFSFCRCTYLPKFGCPPPPRGAACKDDKKTKEEVHHGCGWVTEDMGGWCNGGGWSGLKKGKKYNDPEWRVLTRTINRGRGVIFFFFRINAIKKSRTFRDMGRWGGGGGVGGRRGWMNLPSDIVSPFYPPPPPPSSVASFLVWGTRPPNVPTEEEEKRYLYARASETRERLRKHNFIYLFMSQNIQWSSLLL